MQGSLNLDPSFFRGSNKQQMDGKFSGISPRIVHEVWVGNVMSRENRKETPKGIESPSSPIHFQVRWLLVSGSVNHNLFFHFFPTFFL